MSGSVASMSMSSEEGDSIEMDCLKGNIEDWRDVIFPALNNLPECPNLKILKRDINTFISSVWTGNRDFVIASLEFMRLQTLALQYIIEIKHIGKVRPSKVDETAAPDDLLEEIQPSNERERRAMVLLRVLKLHPDRALSTAKCKELLEASEGSTIDMKPVKRAMEFLDLKYDPLIKLEKIGKNSRIRTNFTLETLRTECPEKSQLSGLRTGCPEGFQDKEKEEEA
jgi:hypothetical protein